MIVSAHSSEPAPLMLAAVRTSHAPIFRVGNFGPSSRCGSSLELRLSCVFLQTSASIAAGPSFPDAEPHCHSLSICLSVYLSLSDAPMRLCSSSQGKPSDLMAPSVLELFQAATGKRATEKERRLRKGPERRREDTRTYL